MPGLEGFVKEGNKFKQTEFLMKLGKSHLGGICLSLVIAWVHACRRTGDPQKSMLALDNPMVISKIVSHHEVYDKGGHGDEGDPLGQFLSPVTVASLFKAVCPDAKAKLVLRSEYMKAPRVSMRRALFSNPLATQAKIFCLVFTCSNEQGITGGHAVGIYWAAGIGGFFDPNHGWIGFEGGMNAVDFSVVLSELEAEYGINHAFCYQYYPS